MFGLFGKKKRAKILLVDDDPSVIQPLRERLEMSDFAVIAASNGREGLEKALDAKPDIILLDNNMPVMNGLEMLERLRENPKGRDICVIMVTAAGRIEDIDHADKCGVDDYIIKPFNTHDLIVKIEAILETRRTLAEV
jgi:two-component system sensor histidine kinase ChiS